VRREAVKCRGREEERREERGKKKKRERYKAYQSRPIVGSLGINIRSVGGGPRRRGRDACGRRGRERGE
jgi:hypothetical protein